MIVGEVRPIAIGWRPEGTHTGGCDSFVAPPVAAPKPRQEMIWRPCSMCWGQGRILEERPGDMTYAHICGTCLGLGTVPASERKWQVLAGDDSEGVW